MIAEIFRTRKELALRVPTFQSRYYFRLKGRNGEIVAQSEGYNSKQACEDTLLTYFPHFDVQDLTGE